MSLRAYLCIFPLKKPLPTVSALVVLLMLSLTSATMAQNYLNAPEAMAYDEAGERFLVANYDGTISSVTIDGRQEQHKTGLVTCSGACLLNGVFYTNCGTGLQTIKGFALPEFNEVFSLKIEQASYLNDLEPDESGRYLFVTDFHADTGEVYRVDLQTGKYIVYTDHIAHFACGMSYEPENNRLVVQSGRMVQSLIQAVSLTDQSVSVLYTSPDFGGFDCLKKDKKGNYYVSSWRAHAVMTLGPDFSDPRIVFTDGYNEASGIEVIEETQQMAVLSFYGNFIEFLPLPASYQAAGLNVTEILYTATTSQGIGKTRTELAKLIKQQTSFKFDGRTLNRVADRLFNEGLLELYRDVLQLNFELYPDSKTLDVQLFCAVLDNDKNTFESLKKKLLNDIAEPGFAASTEATVNNMGYRFVGLEKMDEAIKVFTLNTRLFPNSANAFDSLAEGYKTTGDVTRATQYYQKSLELDPQNNNAREMLAELQN